MNQHDSRGTKLWRPPPCKPVAIAADDFLLKRDGLGLLESFHAAGRPIEFHLLASGGHGFGLGRPGTSSQGWMELFHQWLEVNELLTETQ